MRRWRGRQPQPAFPRLANARRGGGSAAVMRLPHVPSRAAVFCGATKVHLRAARKGEGALCPPLLLVESQTCVLWDSMKNGSSQLGFLYCSQGARKCGSVMRLPSVPSRAAVFCGATKVYPACYTKGGGDAVSSSLPCRVSEGLDEKREKFIALEQHACGQQQVRNPLARDRDLRQRRRDSSSFF